MFLDYYGCFADNTKENHKQFAYYFGSISLGLALGAFLKSYPFVGFAIAALGITLTSIKALQASLTPENYVPTSRIRMSL